MEDEDGESKLRDMWSILEDQQLKDSTLNDTLKRSIDNAYTDGIEEDKQIVRYNSISAKDSPNKNSGTGSKIVFKGFKKRILAQTQETHIVASRSTQEQQALHANVSPKSSKEKRAEAKRGKITEYAQYLGLQPSARSKCSKCNANTNFCSTVKQAQCTCAPIMAPMQGVPSTSESSAVPHAANFKITRKVYLCSACGTYFENWNLFLHMRNIHKRHICLFCLGLFGQAERLSYHLSKKHSVPEMAFTSIDDFYSMFKGSCYLVCCTCEKVFSETDNFYNHFCSPPPKQDVAASVCTLCRQTGTHASTCTFAIKAGKNLNTALSISSTAQAVPTSILDKQSNAGSKNLTKKLIKNNRTKHWEDSLPNSHQQKTSLHAKKVITKVNVTQHKNQTVFDAADKDENIPDETANCSVKDTVSETIMEVSRYIEDSCQEESEEKLNKDAHEEEVPVIKSSSKSDTNEEAYDTVTETIMEVSRCENGKEDKSLMDKEDSVTSNVSDTTEKFDLTTDITSTDNTLNPTEKLDAKLVQPNLLQKESEDSEETENIESTCDIKSDNECNVQNLEHPPVNRSLFSPRHESHATDLESEQECTYDDKKEEELPVSMESQQPPVSFNAAPSADRSLVIKICTNKNSQFSVTTAAMDGNDDDNAGRELEENNNANGEASEDKVSAVVKEEQNDINSCQVNDGDSDSDSDKLAVVDSNAEEAEGAEGAGADTEESKEVKQNGSDINVEHQVNTDDGCTIDILKNETEENGASQDMNEVSNNDEQNSAITNDESSDMQLQTQPSDGIVLAGEDIPTIDLNVEGTLDSIEIEDLLKRCIEAASPICVYCNHARHIAVNGKQLGLHMLAEHKFQPQHPAIIIHTEQFTTRVKKSLDELESRYFNLNTYSSTNGTCNVPHVRMYECFHCRFHSAVHKELYLHNRKMHQKTILICIMCKSTFYSYSELLCHLCPGVYSPNINVRYRCCLCPVGNLPSAFRLMVHLRKRHHACDVCLESTGNQQRLSNHVWKHKLHHLCYRCGIAYRNKPDITKHLFWKHGTESVLCKKCLQKKWPHIYHFCIPPTAFVCEECSSSFSRAVALKVHKRLHSGDQPYTCSECSERFISQKLLAKHETSHKESAIVDVNASEITNHTPAINDEKSEKEKVLAENSADASDGSKEVKEPVKKVVDVYDLPPLNLSSESDTDSEDEKEKAAKQESSEKDKSNDLTSTGTSQAEQTGLPNAINDSIVEVEQNEEEKKQEAQIMDGIWDNFKSYTASLEMQGTANSSLTKETQLEQDITFLRSVVLGDHDYCVVWSDKEKTEEGDANHTKKEDNLNSQNELEKLPRSPSAGSIAQNADQDGKKKLKTPKKKKRSGSTSSSDSSSDSDSSSCSCGTNCSCSSTSSGSSSSSSSSSDSDSSASENSPRKQLSRKERKKDKDSTQATQSGQMDGEHKDAVHTENGVCEPSAEVCPPQLLLRESDLDTDETDTDEDFYDEHPQQLANKLLAEKRNQLLLLAAVAPASTESTMSLNNGITDESVAPSPDPVSLEDQPQQQQKKRIKTKKRKKGERGKQRTATPTVESIKLNIPKAFYQKNSGFSSPSPTVLAAQPSRSSTPSIASSIAPGIVSSVAPGVTPSEIAHHPVNPMEMQALGAANQNVGGSGSETENKRSSKRKRVPKRFYGDSSDEETEKQPTMKWRKAEAPSSFVPVTTLKTAQPSRLSFGGKTVAYKPNVDDQTEQRAAVATSATESEEQVESSSGESSDSDTETGQPQVHLPETNPPMNPERSVNLYCYCQCPYDEVSEMIACDGEDCRIEWFHFECVGIMVPPKGKWYCPDCRKKHGIVQNSDDYFD